MPRRFRIRNSRRNPEARESTKPAREDIPAMVVLLILHGLVGVALLGAITHQSVALLRRGAARRGSFVERYAAVGQRTFTVAVMVMYVIGVVLGGLIYPAYRLDVRIP